jgi:hypothetical protein
MSEKILTAKTPSSPRHIDMQESTKPGAQSDYRRCVRREEMVSVPPSVELFIRGHWRSFAVKNTSQVFLGALGGLAVQSSSLKFKV